jgi:hypothetical protein
MPWLRVLLALFVLSLSRLSWAQDLEGSRALMSDVSRIVAAQEAEEWFTDRQALRAVEEQVLASVCHATPEARAGALAGFDKRRAELGDAQAAFRRSGELNDQVESALTAERRVLVMRHALERVGECPFWIQPRPGFDGLQSDRGRITLNVESGGNVQFRYTEKRWTFGGGGLGRFLVGYGLDGRYSLLVGGEFGGGAMLKPGTDASQFVINYFPAVPVVFRTHFLTFQYDVELAPVALFQADNTDLSWGARIGSTFAFTALRRRNVLPWAGLAVAYEHYFEGGGREAQHFFRGGLRIGLPWDP